MKEIRVFDVNGEELSMTTRKRAYKLVNVLGHAKWRQKNHSIDLLINRKMKNEMKRQVIEEDERICYICGSYIKEDKEVTIDHVRPKSKNGRDIKENQRCCCLRCNQSKHSQTLETYLNHIKENREEFDYVSDEQLNVLTDFLKTYQESEERLWNQRNMS